MAKKKKNQVTIRDVAEQAGVSVTAVSRAMNDRAMISPETKRHILKTAGQLGFSLSVSRPGPKPGKVSRKKKIAFITFSDYRQADADLPLAFYVLQRSVREGGRENRFSVHLHCMDQEDELSGAVEDQDFSGFILQGLRPHPSVEDYLKSRPCCWVMKNRWIPSWGDHIMPDHREVGKLAAEYLVRRGCRKVAALWPGCYSQVSVLREEGFLFEAARQGVDAVYLAAENQPTESGRGFYEAACVDEVVERFKKEVRSADGIFFDSDHMLSALYPLLVKEQIVRPEKTVLISCNNQQPYLKGIAPHPATIDVHYDLIGRIGVSQLAWRMKNKTVHQRIRSLISPTLISLK